MGKLCYLCKRTFERVSTRSYHQFPQNPYMRNSWFQATGLDYVENKQLYLCSDHFAPDSFIMQPQGRRVLKKGATPFVITHENADTKETINSRSTSSSSSCTTISSSSSSESKSETNEGISEHFKMSLMEALEAMSSSSSLTSATVSAIEFAEEAETEEEIVISVDTAVDPVEHLESQVDERSEGKVVENSEMLEKTVPTVQPTIKASQHIKLIKEKQDQAEALENLSASMSDTLEHGAEEPKEKIRKFVQPRYVGDVDPDNFSTPRDARIAFELAIMKMQKQRNKLQKLLQENTRLKIKLKSLESLTNSEDGFDSTGIIETFQVN